MIKIYFESVIIYTIIIYAGVTINLSISNANNKFSIWSNSNNKTTAAIGLIIGIFRSRNKK